MIHRRIYLCAGVALLYAAAVFAQEAVSVSVSTQLTPKVYPPGESMSETAVVVPPGGVNSRAFTLDVSKHTDPSVCVDIWHLTDTGPNGSNPNGGGAYEKNGGAGGICGVIGGPKDKGGNPRSSAGFTGSSSVRLPEGVKIKSLIVINGGSLETNNATQMWDIK